MKMSILKNGIFYTNEEYENGKSSFNCKFETQMNSKLEFLCSMNIEILTHGYYGFDHIYKEDVMEYLNKINLNIDADYYVPDMTKWSNYEKVDIDIKGKIIYNMMSVINLSFYKVII